MNSHLSGLLSSLTLVAYICLYSLSFTIFIVLYEALYCDAVIDGAGVVLDHNSFLYVIDNSEGGKPVGSVNTEWQRQNFSKMLLKFMQHFKLNKIHSIARSTAALVVKGMA